jgi:hypothetical protein
MLFQVKRLASRRVWVDTPKRAASEEMVSPLTIRYRPDRVVGAGSPALLPGVLLRARTWPGKIVDRHDRPLRASTEAVDSENCWATLLTVSPGTTVWEAGRAAARADCAAMPPGTKAAPS